MNVFVECVPVIIGNHFNPNGRSCEILAYRNGNFTFLKVNEIPEMRNSNFLIHLPKNNPELTNFNWNVSSCYDVSTLGKVYPSEKMWVIMI